MSDALVNPYGLEALWRQGDLVARGTLLFLMAMSIGSWYVGIVKFFEQARLLRDARAAAAAFGGTRELQAAGARLRAQSAFRFLAEQGCRAAAEHAALGKAPVDLDGWLGIALERAMDEIRGRLQSGLALLATVGSTAPFVGLFGTVWGIYHALAEIGIAGQASIDKVAGPVGEALIMTALGLAVAVPAVLGYNWLVRRNRVALDELASFAAGLRLSLLGGVPWR